MLFFKDSKDGYYQFEDNAPPAWYAHLTLTGQQFYTPSQTEVIATHNAIIIAQIAEIEHKILCMLCEADPAIVALKAQIK